MARVADFVDVPVWVDSDITVSDIQDIVRISKTDNGFIDYNHGLRGAITAGERMMRDHGPEIMEYLDSAGLLESVAEAIEIGSGGALSVETSPDTFFAALEAWAVATCEVLQ
jgi:hypothetical protein